MDSNKILKLADFFYALATSEALPDNSKKLKTILKNIDELETHGARKKYADKNLKYLSSGSSRRVYLASDNTVIKLAANDKGLSQNKAEANASKKCKSKYLNKLLGESKKYYWIEMPYLEKIDVKDFKKMTDIDFEDFGESIRYSLKSVSGNDKNKPKNYDEISKSSFFKEMTKIGKELSLMGGDLARISSYGEKGGHPVLIDAGLTKKVFDKFYDSSSSSSSSSK